MAVKSNYTMKHRRRREGKTNYNSRLKLLVSRKPRLVIRRTLKGIIAQIVTYTPDGDTVIHLARSSELTQFGLPVVNGNIPTAYLTGFLLAKKAKDFKEELIVDFGVRSLTPKSRLFATVKGAIEGGLKVIASDDSFPDDSRVQGKHIQDYAVLLKDNDEAYKKQFGEYLSQKVNPQDISGVYAKVKSALEK